MLVAREEAQAAITNLNLSERQGKEAHTLTRSLTRTQNKDNPRIIQRKSRGETMSEKPERNKGSL